MDGMVHLDETPPLFGDEHAPPEPPNNVELEQALLGAVLVDYRTWDRVIEAVPEFGKAAFYDPNHQLIAETIERAAERGQRIDAKMVAHSLGPDLHRYIGELAAGALNIIDAPEYAKTLQDLALARALAPVLERAVEAIYRPGAEKTAREQIAEVEDSLFELAERGHESAGPQTLTAATARALQRAQEAQRGGGMLGLSTGIRTIDEMTGGLAAPDLIILAGRPGMGKTKLGSRIAFNVARRGEPVLVFSLEMSSEQIATAELSSASGVPLHAIRRGRLNDSQWDHLIEAQGQLGSLPIQIDDTPAITPAQMRSRARRHKRRHGLSLVVVDYLQLMRAPGGVNLNERVTHISQSLKALAKELEVPVVALSQLSRAVEQREDKRPMLSDLRDSGSIEQDADMVWMLYRPAYYHREPRKADKETPEQFSARLLEHSERVRTEANVLEFIIAKFRQGETGSKQLFADLATSTFGDFEQQEEVPF